MADISLIKINKKIDTKIQNLIFLMVMLAVAIFVIWRCQFGFAQSDEFLHLSIPYRMLQGDALIAEEWHQTQLAGFVYYPVTKLIFSLLGSVDGLVFWSRVACVVMELAVAVFIYLRLKSLSWVGALVAAVSFALYTPVALTSIYYYSVGIMTMVIATVLIATAQHHIRRDYFIAGISMAASVMCFPHAAFMYFIYAAVVLAAWLKHRSAKTAAYGRYEFLSPKMFGFFTLGVAVLTAVFAVYLVLYVPLDKLFASIEPIMTDEHHNITFLYKLAVYFGSVVLYNSKIAGVLMALLLAELVFRRKLRNSTYFIAAAVLTVVLQIHIMAVNHQIDYLMFAPTCFGLFCALLSENEKVKRLFHTLYIPGVVYTFFLNLSSNQGFVAVSAAATVSTIASIVMAAMYLKELTAQISTVKIRKLCIAALCCLFIVQIAFQGCSRYVSVYGAGKIENQNIKLDHGVMKGLVVDETHAEDYEMYCDIAKTAQQNYNYEKVLAATQRSWMNFMFGKEISGFSAYLNYVDEEFMTKQARYFEINPHKLPDIVYAQDTDVEFTDWFLANYSGYSMDKYDFGYIIYRDGCKKE
ncbi:MAG: hypothetical protein IJO54_00340 [Oscillospiraceae bacterium]|nr:hypothetical protein [Oscillospiraceae bacterium]